LISDGYALIRNLIAEFNLCPKLCFIQRNNDPCSGLTDQICKGACELRESNVDYNRRVMDATEHLKNISPTFAIIDRGRNINERSCILMEKGTFYGMGFIGSGPATGISELRNLLTKYPSNDYIKNMIQNYALRYPSKIVSYDAQPFELNIT
ncbi:MAG: exonuclease domain-containing protein, partial [Daejeonella sp.]